MKDKTNSGGTSVKLKRIAQFAAFFIIAIPFISFLPLYFRRVMTRLYTSGGGGDIIDYKLQIDSLYEIYWVNYQWSSREGDFYFWLVVNICLAIVYAFAVALSIVLLLIYRKRRKINSNHLSD